MEVEIKTETEHLVHVTDAIVICVTREKSGDFSVERHEKGHDTEMFVDMSRAELEALSKCIASALATQ